MPEAILRAAMTKPDLALLKIPTTLTAIYHLVEHLTGRPVTEADKRACERLVATNPDRGVCPD
jgi:hypothetical protein